MLQHEARGALSSSEMFVTDAKMTSQSHLARASIPRNRAMRKLGKEFFTIRDTIVPRLPPTSAPESGRTSFRIYRACSDTRAYSYHPMRQDDDIGRGFPVTRLLHCASYSQTSKLGRNNRLLQGHYDPSMASSHVSTRVALRRELRRAMVTTPHLLLLMHCLHVPE